MSAERLATIAENLVADVIFGLQFDRSGEKRVISGCPLDYFRYVKEHIPSLTGDSLTRVATFVRMNVESYIGNLLSDEQIKMAQVGDVLPLYQFALMYQGLADSPEQLIGAAMAAFDRELSEPEKGLVVAIFGGESSAIMESLTEVAPEGAYMAPSGLPAPVSPGLSYSMEAAFAAPGLMAPMSPAIPMIAIKRSSAIPIHRVGQWGKPVPRLVKDLTVSPQRRKSPSQTWEERFTIPEWKRSFGRILGYTPTESVSRALEEFSLSDDPSYEEVDNFMKVLSKQPYLGGSKEYVQWWLENHGTGLPEPEPERLVPPTIPWTER